MANAVCSECRSELEMEALPELAGELESELEMESELEGAGEFEAEMESEISPIRKIYPDALMEHLGELAAEAETEQEAAEHFLPLIGMAASKLLPVVARAIAPAAKKALPRIAKSLTRVTPQLTKGIGKIARGLHRRPGTRPLLRAVPTIARRTVHSIARQVAQRRPVTPRTAVRTLAQQTQRVLSSPRQRANALRQHQRLDQRFHGRLGGGMVRPHLGYGTAVTQYPGVVAAPTVAGQPVTKNGRIVTGQYVCPPCPACGTALGVQAPVGASPAPAYCRCCGQLLR
jgi:hypothetical protein